MASLVIAGREQELAESCTIGRARSCGLMLDHASISREHARVWNRDGTWLIEDLLSANGTSINGQPVLGGDAPLADGDVILVGEVEIRFRLTATTAAPPPDPAVIEAASLVGRELAGYAVSALERQEIAGPVYRAKHRRTGRDVLLWILDPEIERHESAGFSIRFRDMLSVVVGLRHPGIIRVYQCGHDDGWLWYATDIPGGETLDRIAAPGLTPSRAVELTLALCRTLAAYHAAGVTHGDIRPGLVHLDASGRASLGSLGLAGLGSANRRRLQAAGSAEQAYCLDPVQARTGDCNVKSDMYSVGCVLVRLLTGLPPFPGDTHQAVLAAHDERPVPTPAAQLGLPAHLDEIISGMLAKDPFNRYNDLTPVIEELSAIQPAITEAEKSLGRLASRAMRWIRGKP